MSIISKIDLILNKFETPPHKETDEAIASVIDRDTLTLSCTQMQLPGWSFSFDVTDVVYTKKSKYQDIKIVESPIFDRCLLIDGQMQSSVKDEFIYHESLVHPAMLCHPNPQRVFIGGGGECATAREILKYPSVQKLISCDLDRDVIDASREHLPTMYGANDKRCEIVIQDAKTYLEQYDGEFDVIIMDICDPIEAGPGIVCYFKEFYQTCQQKLSENGILVTQSTACGLLLYHECFTIIVNTLQGVFNEVMPYSAYVPTFYAQWGFTMAFKQSKPKWFWDLEHMDEELEKKLGPHGVRSLKYYDATSHLGMFRLPKYLRHALEKETRVMTKATPYYQF